MTTIAIKDGVMAADSKCSDESGYFVTKCTKMFRLANGALLGSAGDSDIRSLMEILGKATAKRMPSRAELAETKTSFNGILAFQGGKTFYVDVYTDNQHGVNVEWTAQVVEIEERMGSVGSGSQFALGAMRAGRTAAQSVVIACHYDSNSAPPVREITVKQPPRKKAVARG